MLMNRNHLANLFKILAISQFLLTIAWPCLAAEEASPLFIQAQRSADRDGYTLITTKGLGRLLDEQPGVVLLDVRFAYEYAQGRIPGSISLPVDLRDRGDLPPERRQAFLEALGPDREQTIVVFCRDFR